MSENTAQNNMGFLAKNFFVVRQENSKKNPLKYMEGENK